MRRRASALLSALLILLVVTMVGASTLRQVAVWHAAYLLRLQQEDAALADAWRSWKGLSSP